MLRGRPSHDRVRRLKPVAMELPACVRGSRCSSGRAYSGCLRQFTFVVEPDDDREQFRLPHDGRGR
jgi:hypothetical protein